MSNHPTNAELFQALYESKLNSTSHPRGPDGRYWPMPAMEHRFTSIKDVEPWKLPDGETIILTHDDDYIPEHGRVRRHDGGIPFVPIQLHRLVVAGGKIISQTELTRAFWRNGQFEIFGQLTNGLGRMFYQLIGKIARRTCWRGYTYRDTFEELALEYLCRYALKFDHMNSRVNPIGYLNICITNAFKREVQKQAKHTHYEDNPMMQQHLGMSSGYEGYGNYA